MAVVAGAAFQAAPEKAPESLLPEGFDVPAPAPAAPAELPPLVEAPPEDGAAPLLDAPVEQAPDPFAVAATAGPSIGVLPPEAGGYGPGIFAGADGRVLAGLARRITAPGASRWAAITLRRALLSVAAAPAGITPGDWVAARAGLLLRIGEIDGARRLVDALPVDRYTPQLYKVAADVALAAGDVAALCPIADTGRLLWKEPMWDLALAMCSALAGDDITAAAIQDLLRGQRGRVDPFDLRLASRVGTLAGSAGRASGVDWTEAPPLNLFRFGVATAAGINVPAERLAQLGPARAGWLVRNPAVAAEVRLGLLRSAAASGSMSVAELTSGVAALAAPEASGGYADDSRAGRLQTAFTGSAAARVAALAAIRGDGADRFGALLDAAAAAARLRPAAALADASPDIVAALVAGGDVARARAWWPVADRAGGAVRARAWAVLAAAGAVPATVGDFKDWRSETKASDRQAARLLAGLIGSGAARGNDWNGLAGDLLPEAANAWTRAIDRAGAAGRAGEVAVLAATGLQGPMNDVPAFHIRHITAALARSGRAAEARLIAAEVAIRA